MIENMGVASVDNVTILKSIKERLVGKSGLRGNLMGKDGFPSNLGLLLDQILIYLLEN